MYGEKRYLAITTNHLIETPTIINPRQVLLDAFYASLVPESKVKALQNTSGGLRACRTLISHRRPEATRCYSGCYVVT